MVRIGKPFARRRNALLLTCVTLLAAAACAPQLRVQTDVAPGADFSSFRTFAWIDESAYIRGSGSDVPISALTIRRIERAIDRELRSRGYDLAADPANADFVVSFTVGARDKIEVTSFPPGYRGRWWGRWPYYGPDVREYSEGHLAIDVFDARSRDPVWFGSGMRNITSSDVEDPEAAIDTAVELILASFPGRR